MSPKRRKIDKVLSRTGRSTVQLSASGAVTAMIEAFTNFDKGQIVAIYGFLTLCFVVLQNVLEQRFNIFLFETPGDNAPDA